MKTHGLVLAAAILALSSDPAAISQQSTPPALNQANSGPSLAVTMQFIQEKLSQQGKINFAIYIHDNASGSDSVGQGAYEISNVVSHPESCTISFHTNLWQASGIDSSVPFRDVQDIVILPVEQVWKEIDNKAGHTARTYKSDPPVFVLRARLRFANIDFIFTDEDLANRVAKATVHAVELCGGGSKDPF
jgi:hypothetical protein